jgi:hypothetical protein
MKEGRKKKGSSSLHTIASQFHAKKVRNLEFGNVGLVIGS